MNRRSIVGAAIAATLILGGCGGGGGGGNSLNTGPEALIKVPNVVSGTNFSFDISDVDSAKGRMYFTDRNNKSVDVIDIKTNTFLKQITGGFTGCNPLPTCVGAVNPKSGPDGLNRIPGTTFIYVGDVNSVKIIDTQTDTVVNTIPIGGTSGFRADEGCYDPDHKIFMIASPDEAIPFATFIDTTTQKIIATLLFTDPGTGSGGPPSAGLEACVYDHGTASFLVNNDGSTANPNGEVDVIPAAAILVGTPAAPVTLTLPAIAPGNGFKVFPLGNCDPTGIDLGPGTDMISECRQGTAGVQLTTQILNRTNGAVLATSRMPAGDGRGAAHDPDPQSDQRCSSRDDQTRRRRSGRLRSFAESLLCCREPLDRERALFRVRVHRRLALHAGAGDHRCRDSDADRKSADGQQCALGHGRRYYASGLHAVFVCCRAGGLLDVQQCAGWWRAGIRTMMVRAATHDC